MHAKMAQQHSSTVAKQMIFPVSRVLACLPACLSAVCLSVCLYMYYLYRNWRSTVAK